LKDLRIKRLKKNCRRFYSAYFLILAILINIKKLLPRSYCPVPKGEEIILVFYPVPKGNAQVFILPFIINYFD